MGSPAYYNFPKDYEKDEYKLDAELGYVDHKTMKLEPHYEDVDSAVDRRPMPQEAPHKDASVLNDGHNKLDMTGSLKAAEHPHNKGKISPKVHKDDSFHPMEVESSTGAGTESGDWAQMVESSWEQDMEREKSEDSKFGGGFSLPTPKDSGSHGKERGHGKSKSGHSDKEHERDNRGKTDKPRKDNAREPRSRRAESAASGYTPPSGSTRGKASDNTPPNSNPRGKSGDGGSAKRRNEWGAPPPIPLQQSQQNTPHRSNYTSLKRSHSTVSNSSLNDRKTESPKAPETPPGTIMEAKTSQIHANEADMEGKVSKDSKAENDFNRDAEPFAPSDLPDDKEVSQSKGSEKSRQLGDEAKREDGGQRKDSKDSSRQRDKDKGRQGRGKQERRQDNDRPPTKKMRDEYRLERSDKRTERTERHERNDLYETRDSVRGGGRGRAPSREFVRGGSGRGGRGRSGYSSGRGRGRSSRHGGYDGYDGYDMSSGMDNLSLQDNLRSDTALHYKEALQRRTDGDKSEDRLYGEGNTGEASRYVFESTEAPQKPDVTPLSISNDASGVKAPEKTIMSLMDTEKFPDPSFQDFVFDDGHRKRGSRDRRDRNREEGGGRGASKSGDRRRRDNKRGGEKRDGRRDGRQEDRKDPGHRENRRDTQEDSGRYDSQKGRSDKQFFDEDRDDIYWNKAASEDQQRSKSASYTPRGDSSRRGNSAGRGRRGRASYSTTPTRGAGYGKTSPKDSKSLDNGTDNTDPSARAPRGSRPPRFSQNSAGGGGRGSYSERPPGAGRSRGSRTSSSSAPKTPNKKPPLAKQNSSDLGNEEWETASESSDVFERKDFKSDSNKENKEKRDAKKSFSNQRPSSDRQNRRQNSSDNVKVGGAGPAHVTTDSSNGPASGARAGPVKEKSPSLGRPNGSFGGSGRDKNGGGSRGNNKTPNSSNRRPVDVYRVDQVVPEDPSAIQNAIDSVNNSRNKAAAKKSDLTDVSKPLKTEKEKKDALANIDINNYARVVVIDNQPEVTIDDPAYLFECNEGFQEVTSKKAQKLKRAAQDEVLKKAIEVVSSTPPSHKKDDAKKDKQSAKRTIAVAESKRRHKLPPRFAKQREHKEHKDKIPPTAVPSSSPAELPLESAAQDILPKIENWDNDMAKSIPSKESAANREHSMSPMEARSGLSGNFAMKMPMPAPKPAVSAWEKPMSTMVSTSSTGVLPIKGKYTDKGEQPDSGIDISEPLNSATSSTRSSPSAERSAKAKPQIVEVDNVKPQRKPKVARSAVGDKSVHSTSKLRVEVEATENVDDTSSAGPPGPKAPKVSSSQPIEAIQLPASFKDTFQFPKEDASQGFSFTFDANLGLTDDKVKSLDDNNKSLRSQAPSLQSPTSPATDDLDQKIAKAKNVWENYQPEAPLYDQTSSHMTSSGVVLPSNSATVSVTSDDIVEAPAPNSFSAFVESSSVAASVVHHMAGQADPTSDLGLPSHKDRPEDSGLSTPQAINVSVTQVLSSYGQQDSAMSSSAASMGSAKPADFTDSSNICKVKPQQHQQVSASSHSQSHSAVAAWSGGHTNPSPPAAPVIITQMSQYHPFALGSSQPNVLAQEARPYNNQAMYGFNLNQPQPQAPLSQQAQPQAPLGQQAQPQAPLSQTYSQPSLMLQPSPAQGAGLPQSDVYQSSTQQYRSQQFGQSQQPSTIMVSSTTTSLMSAAVKPPSTSQYMSAGQQKTSSLSGLPYGPLLGLGSGSQFFMQTYDQGQAQPQTPTAPGPAAAPPQNVNNSQMIGSHIVGQRSGLPPVQNQSSFYTQPLQQTGFYQAQQVATSMANLQQVAAAPSQFSIQGYGAQPQNLNLPIQTLSLSSQSQLNKSAAPFKPAAQQQQAPQHTNQLKSPPHSATPTSSFPGGLSTFNMATGFPPYNSGNKLPLQITNQFQSSPCNNFEPSTGLMPAVQNNSGPGAGMMPPVQNSSGPGAGMMPPVQNNSGPGAGLMPPVQNNAGPVQAQQTGPQLHQGFPSQHQPQQQQQQQQQQQSQSPHQASGHSFPQPQNALLRESRGPQRPQSVGPGLVSHSGLATNNTLGSSVNHSSSGQQFPQKRNSFVPPPTAIQPNAPLMRAQLMMAMRGASHTSGPATSASHNASYRFNSPAQSQPPQPPAPTPHLPPKAALLASTSSPTASGAPTRTPRPTSNNTSGSGNSSSQKVKEMQAKQRQELLQHAASFLSQHTAKTVVSNAPPAPVVAPPTSKPPPKPVSMDKEAPVDSTTTMTATPADPVATQQEETPKE